MNIEQTDKISENQGIFGVIYSESGVGKTTMITSLKKPLLIDFEGGASVLRKEKIDVVTVKPTLDGYKTLMKEIQDITGYDTVVFDGITAIEMNLLAFFGKSSSSLMPTLNNYGVLNSCLLQTMIDVKALKYKGLNVLVTATEMSLEESLPDGRVISRYYPNISAGKGKYAKRLVGEADIVGRMVISTKEDNAGERFIILEKGENFVAKDRIYKRKFCKPADFFTQPEGKGEKKDAI